MRGLTKDNFKQEISKGVILVDMFAEWCGPCKALAPMLAELEAKLESVVFTKLDVDEADNIAQEYGVMSIPCVIIFKDGKEVSRIVGLNAKDKYEAELKKVLAIA